MGQILQNETIKLSDIAKTVDKFEDQKLGKSSTEQEAINNIYDALSITKIDPGKTLKDNTEIRLNQLKEAVASGRIDAKTAAKLVLFWETKESQDILLNALDAREEAMVRKSLEIDKTKQELGTLRANLGTQEKILTNYDSWKSNANSDLFFAQDLFSNLPVENLLSSLEGDTKNETREALKIYLLFDAATYIVSDLITANIDPNGNSPSGNTIFADFKTLIESQGLKIDSTEKENAVWEAFSQAYIKALYGDAYTENDAELIELTDTTKEPLKNFSANANQIADIKKFLTNRNLSWQAYCANPVYLDDKNIPRSLTAKDGERIGSSLDPHNNNELLQEFAIIQFPEDSHPTVQELWDNLGIEAKDLEKLPKLKDLPQFKRNLEGKNNSESQESKDAKALIQAFQNKSFKAGEPMSINDAGDLQVDFKCDRYRVTISKAWERTSKKRQFNWAKERYYVRVQPKSTSNTYEKGYLIGDKGKQLADKLESNCANPVFALKNNNLTKEEFANTDTTHQERSPTKQQPQTTTRLQTLQSSTTTGHQISKPALAQQSEISNEGLEINLADANRFFTQIKKKETNAIDSDHPGDIDPPLSYKLNDKEYKISATRKPTSSSTGRKFTDQWYLAVNFDGKGKIISSDGRIANEGSFPTVADPLGTMKLNKYTLPVWQAVMSDRGAIRNSPETIQQADPDTAKEKRNTYHTNYESFQNTPRAYIRDYLKQHPTTTWLSFSAGIEGITEENIVTALDDFLLVASEALTEPSKPQSIEAWANWTYARYGNESCTGIEMTKNFRTKLATEMLKLARTQKFQNDASIPPQAPEYLQKLFGNSPLVRLIANEYIKANQPRQQIHTPSSTLTTLASTNIQPAPVAPTEIATNIQNAVAFGRTFREGRFTEGQAGTEHAGDLQTVYTCPEFSVALSRALIRVNGILQWNPNQYYIRVLPNGDSAGYLIDPDGQKIDKPNLKSSVSAPLAALAKNQLTASTFTDALAILNRKSESQLVVHTTPPVVTHRDSSLTQSGNRGNVARPPSVQAPTATKEAISSQDGIQAITLDKQYRSFRSNSIEKLVGPLVSKFDGIKTKPSLTTTDVTDLKEINTLLPFAKDLETALAWPDNNDTAREAALKTQEKLLTYTKKNPQALQSLKDFGIITGPESIEMAWDMKELMCALTDEKVQEICKDKPLFKGFTDEIIRITQSGKPVEIKKLENAGIGAPDFTATPGKMFRDATSKQIVFRLLEDRYKDAMNIYGRVELITETGETITPLTDTKKQAENPEIKNYLRNWYANQRPTDGSEYELNWARFCQSPAARKLEAKLELTQDYITDTTEKDEYLSIFGFGKRGKQIAPFAPGNKALYGKFIESGIDYVDSEMLNTADQLVASIERLMGAHKYLKDPELKSTREYLLTEYVRPILEQRADLTADIEKLAQVLPQIELDTLKKDIGTKEIEIWRHLITDRIQKSLKEDHKIPTANDLKTWNLTGYINNQKAFETLFGSEIAEYKKTKTIAAFESSAKNDEVKIIEGRFLINAEAQKKAIDKNNYQKVDVIAIIDDKGEIKYYVDGREIDITQISDKASKLNDKKIIDAIGSHYGLQRAKNNIQEYLSGDKIFERSLVFGDVNNPEVKITKPQGSNTELIITISSSFNENGKEITKKVKNINEAINLIAELIKPEEINLTIVAEGSSYRITPSALEIYGHYSNKQQYQQNYEDIHNVRWYIARPDGTMFTLVRKMDPTEKKKYFIQNGEIPYPKNADFTGWTSLTTSGYDINENLFNQAILKGYNEALSKQTRENNEKEINRLLSVENLTNAQESLERAFNAFLNNLSNADKILQANKYSDISTENQFQAFKILITFADLQEFKNRIDQQIADAKATYAYNYMINGANIKAAAEYRTYSEFSANKPYKPAENWPKVAARNIDNLAYQAYEAYFKLQYGAVNAGLDLRVTAIERYNSSHDQDIKAYLRDTSITGQKTYELFRLTYGVTVEGQTKRAQAKDIPKLKAAYAKIAAEQLITAQTTITKAELETTLKTQGITTEELASPIFQGVRGVLTAQQAKIEDTTRDETERAANEAYQQYWTNLDTTNLVSTTPDLKKALHSKFDADKTQFSTTPEYNESDFDKKLEARASDAKWGNVLETNGQMPVYENIGQAVNAIIDAINITPAARTEYIDQLIQNNTDWQAVIKLKDNEGKEHTLKLNIEFKDASSSDTVGQILEVKLYVVELNGDPNTKPAEITFKADATNRPANDLGIDINDDRENYTVSFQRSHWRQTLGSTIEDTLKIPLSRKKEAQEDTYYTEIDKWAKNYPNSLTAKTRKSQQNISGTSYINFPEKWDANTTFQAIQAIYDFEKQIFEPNMDTRKTNLDQLGPDPRTVSNLSTVLELGTRDSTVKAILEAELITATQEYEDSEKTKTLITRFETDKKYIKIQHISPYFSVFEKSDTGKTLKLSFNYAQFDTTDLKIQIIKEALESDNLEISLSPKAKRGLGIFNKGTPEQRIAKTKEIFDRLYGQAALYAPAISTYSAALPSHETAMLQTSSTIYLDLSLLQSVSESIFYKIAQDEDDKGGSDISGSSPSQDRRVQMEFNERLRKGQLDTAAARLEASQEVDTQSYEIFETAHSVDRYDDDFMTTLDPDAPDADSQRMSARFNILQNYQVKVPEEVFQYLGRYNKAKGVVSKTTENIQDIPVIAPILKFLSTQKLEEWSTLTTRNFGKDILDGFDKMFGDRNDLLPMLIARNNRNTISFEDIVEAKIIDANKHNEQGLFMGIGFKKFQTRLNALEELKSLTGTQDIKKVKQLLKKAGTPYETLTQQEQKLIESGKYFLPIHQSMYREAEVFMLNAYILLGAFKKLSEYTEEAMTEYLRAKNSMPEQRYKDSLKKSLEIAFNLKGRALNKKFREELNRCSYQEYLYKLKKEKLIGLGLEKVVDRKLEDVTQIATIYKGPYSYKDVVECKPGSENHKIKPYESVGISENAIDDFFEFTENKLSASTKRYFKQNPQAILRLVYKVRTQGELEADKTIWARTQMSKIDAIRQITSQISDPNQQKEYIDMLDVSGIFDNGFAVLNIIPANILTQIIHEVIEINPDNTKPDFYSGTNHAFNNYFPSTRYMHLAKTEATKAALQDHLGSNDRGKSLYQSIFADLSSEEEIASKFNSVFARGIELFSMTADNKLEAFASIWVEMEYNYPEMAKQNIKNDIAILEAKETEQSITDAEKLQLQQYKTDQKLINSDDINKINSASYVKALKKDLIQAKIALMQNFSIDEFKLRLFESGGIRNSRSIVNLIQYLDPQSQEIFSLILRKGVEQEVLIQSEMKKVEMVFGAFRSKPNVQNTLKELYQLASSAGERIKATDLFEYGKRIEQFYAQQYNEGISPENLLKFQSEQYREILDIISKGANLAFVAIKKTALNGDLNNSNSSKFKSELKESLTSEYSTNILTAFGVTILNIDDLINQWSNYLVLKNNDKKNAKQMLIANPHLKTFEKLISEKTFLSAVDTHARNLDNVKARATFLGNVTFILKDTFTSSLTEEEYGKLSKWKQIRQDEYDIGTNIGNFLKQITAFYETPRLDIPIAGPLGLTLSLTQNLPTLSNPRLNVGMELHRETSEGTRQYVGANINFDVIAGIKDMFQGKMDQETLEKLQAQARVYAGYEKESYDAHADRKSEEIINSQDFQDKLARSRTSLESEVVSKLTSVSSEELNFIDDPIERQRAAESIAESIAQTHALHIEEIVRNDYKEAYYDDLWPVSLKGIEIGAMFRASVKEKSLSASLYINFNVRFKGSMKKYEIYPTSFLMDEMSDRFLTEKGNDETTRVISAGLDITLDDSAMGKRLAYSANRFAKIASLPDLRINTATGKPMVINYSRKSSGEEAISNSIDLPGKTGFERYTAAVNDSVKDSDCSFTPLDKEGRQIEGHANPYEAILNIDNAKDALVEVHIDPRYKDLVYQNPDDKTQILVSLKTGLSPIISRETFIYQKRNGGFVKHEIVTIRMARIEGKYGYENIFNANSKVKQPLQQIVTLFANKDTDQISTKINSINEDTWKTIYKAYFAKHGITEQNQPSKPQEGYSAYLSAKASEYLNAGTTLEKRNDILNENNFKIFYKLINIDSFIREKLISREEIESTEKSYYLFMNHETLNTSSEITEVKRGNIIYTQMNSGNFNDNENLKPILDAIETLDSASYLREGQQHRIMIRQTLEYAGIKKEELSSMPIEKQEFLNFIFRMTQDFNVYLADKRRSIQREFAKVRIDDRDYQSKYGNLQKDLQTCSYTDEGFIKFLNEEGREKFLSRLSRIDMLFVQEKLGVFNEYNELSNQEITDQIIKIRKERATKTQQLAALLTRRDEALESEITEMNKQESTLIQLLELRSLKKSLAITNQLTEINARAENLKTIVEKPDFGYILQNSEWKNLIEAQTLDEQQKINLRNIAIKMIGSKGPHGLENPQGGLIADPSIILGEMMVTLQGASQGSNIMEVLNRSPRVIEIIKQTLQNNLNTLSPLLNGRNEFTAEEMNYLLSFIVRYSYVNIFGLPPVYDDKGELAKKLNDEEVITKKAIYTNQEDSSKPPEDRFDAMLKQLKPITQLSEATKPTGEFIINLIKNNPDIVGLANDNAKIIELHNLVVNELLERTKTSQKIIKDWLNNTTTSKNKKEKYYELVLETQRAKFDMTNEFLDPFNPKLEAANTALSLFIKNEIPATSEGKKMLIDFLGLDIQDTDYESIISTSAANTTKPYYGGRTILYVHPDIVSRLIVNINFRDRSQQSIDNARSDGTTEIPEEAQNYSMLNLASLNYLSPLPDNPNLRNEKIISIRQKSKEAFDITKRTTGSAEYISLTALNIKLNQLLSSSTKLTSYEQINVIIQQLKDENYIDLHNVISKYGNGELTLYSLDDVLFYYIKDKYASNLENVDIMEETHEFKKLAYDLFNCPLGMKTASTIGPIDSLDYFFGGSVNLTDLKKIRDIFYRPELSEKEFTILFNKQLTKIPDRIPEFMESMKRFKDILEMQRSLETIIDKATIPEDGKGETLLTTTEHGTRYDVSIKRSPEIINSDGGIDTIDYMFKVIDKTHDNKVYYMRPNAKGGLILIDRCTNVSTAASESGEYYIEAGSLLTPDIILNLGNAGYRNKSDILPEESKTVINETSVAIGVSPRIEKVFEKNPNTETPLEPGKDPNSILDETETSNDGDSPSDPNGDTGSGTGSELGH